MAYNVTEEINIFSQGGLYFVTFIIEDDENIMPPQRSNVFYPDDENLQQSIDAGKIAECNYWTNFYYSTLPTPEPTPIPGPVISIDPLNP